MRAIMLTSLATMPFFMTVLSYGQCATYIVQPSNASVIEGLEVRLKCQVRPGKLPPSWYVYSDDLATSSKTVEPRPIYHGYQNRFFLIQWDGVSILYVNMTSMSDTGVYFCLSGHDASLNATLRVLPGKWVPYCASNPTGALGVGDQLDIVCLSKGDPGTFLRWMRNNDVISGSSRSVNGTSVILHASVVISDEAEVFICEASLPDLHHAPEICVLRPTKGLQVGTSTVQYAAYAVVSVLSVVVVILFIAMIVVILRRRQCRYCRRRMPTPQTVLDMDQLQSGLGMMFTPERTEYDSDSIGSAFDLTTSSPPPDVVPTVNRRGPWGQKSPTSTLRHNMDLSDEEKPGVKTPTLPSPTRIRRELETMDQAFESLDQRQTEVGDVSLDPNVPTTSGGRTSSEVTSRNSSTENQGSLNDLGTLKKERLYRKSKMSAGSNKRKLSNNSGGERNSEVTRDSDSVSLNIKHEEVHQH